MKAWFWRSEACGAALAAAVLSLVLVAVLGSCKNNPPASGGGGAPAGAIPVVAATPAEGEALRAPVLTSPVWAGAHWVTLTPPLKETKTTPSTRVACTYDAQRLYVAFVGVAGGAGAGQTKVSVLLDTSKAQNGTEYIEIVAVPEPVGDASVRGVWWHRSALPPEPNPDGTVSYKRPAWKVPGVTIKGLEVVAGKGEVDGQAGWTVVFAIPVQALPTKLQATPTVGARWRLNLLREDDLGAGDGGGREVVAGNLSPVFLGQLAAMPYRMAELVLVPVGGVAKVK